MDPLLSSSLEAQPRRSNMGADSPSLDLARLMEELGGASTLKDPCVRRLLRALIEQWARQCDDEVEKGFLRDLTAGYADSIHQLLELNRNKNRLLGMASHDLRNPLLSIRGLAEILLTGVTGTLSPDQKEYLSIISSASNGMLVLVNDLLDVSVIESGKMTIQRVMGSMRPLAEERLQVYAVIAEEKGIRLSAQYGEVPDFVFDPGRIGQVMDNLLSNAVKFSPPGSSVRVSLEREGGGVKFSVEDSGPGIPPEDLEKIFVEFETARVRPTGGERSTGLGLAIARRIVEAHGGSISVCKGRLGAVFSFSIPF